MEEGSPGFLGPESEEKSFGIYPRSDERKMKEQRRVIREFIKVKQKRSSVGWLFLSVALLL